MNKVILSTVICFTVLSGNLTSVYAKSKQIETSKWTSKPILLVISAPSGTGKTTVMNEIMRRNPKIEKLISVTTRAPRPTEQADVDYRFITKKEYFKAEKKYGLIQKSINYGNYYGIFASDAMNLIKDGHDGIVDVNFDGANQLRKSLKANFDVITIYMMPPSIIEIYNRLNGRKTDDAAVIKGRMGKVYDALEGWEEYDYTVIADTTANVADKILQIYNTRLLRRDELVKAYQIFPKLKAERGVIFDDNN